MSEKPVRVYWLPHCTTCQKAVEYLEKIGCKVAEFRDLKSNPLGRKEVEDLARLAGGAGKLFSRRAVKYRELKLSERDLAPDEMIQLMSEEYTFIKRPVIVWRQSAIAGFSTKSIDVFLKI